MQDTTTTVPTTVADLRHQNLLWFANSAPLSKKEARSTGFQILDEKLAGGFPDSGVVEVSTNIGIGELRLLMPYLQQQNRLPKNKQRLCILVNPPIEVNPHAFHYEAIDHEQLLIIRDDDKSKALWAAEQSLRSGACHTVMAWHHELEIHQAKRLQVASEQGEALLFLFQQPNQNALSLPISLCLTLRPEPTGLNITITKRRGGYAHGSFSVPMDAYWPQLTTSPLRHQPCADIFLFPTPVMQKQG